MSADHLPSITGAGSTRSSESPWAGLVVMSASNGWTGMRMQDRHIAEPLSRFAPVLYVDPPLSPLARWRNPKRAEALREARMRQVAPNLARLSPVVAPGIERAALNKLNTAILRRTVRRAVHQLGGPVRAVIDSCPTLPVLGSCDEQLKVFWAQDDFVANAELVGVSPELAAAGEWWLADHADVIIASTPLVAETWKARGYDPLLIPYGCDGEQYVHVDDAPLPADVHLPSPVVGVVGHIGERIDTELLIAVADRGHSLLLVGARNPNFDIERLGQLMARPNVTWVGPKEFEQLPGYLRMIDVGLVPYNDSAFNRASFPLKTLEYLAAGRAVVATDLPATRWLDTDLVDIATGPRDFADAVDRALALSRSAELMRRRQAFAAEHTWARRAEAFATALGISG